MHRRSSCSWGHLCLLLLLSRVGIVATSTRTLDEENSLCTFCPDGSAIDPALAFKKIPNAAPLVGFVPTCQELEEWTSNIPASSNDCAVLRNAGSICGCPAAGTCTLCRPGDNITTPYKVVPFLQAWYGFQPTCELWEAILLGTAQDGDIYCSGMRLYSWVCGCNYYGFDQELWIVLSRISGSISLVASLFLVIYILRDAKRRAGIYHDIILCISCCDIISSLMFVLADIPVPLYEETTGTKDEYDSPSCTAQGFFIQFGLTAMFFNVSLTLFYMLTIAQGWSKTRVERAKIWLLGVPFVFGLSLACVGIPFYTNNGGYCWFASLYLVDLFGLPQWPVIWLAIVPICLAIATITLMQLRIFLAVRKAESKMLKWRFSRRNMKDNDRRTRVRSLTARERQVFWQSVAYVGTFYLTWPVIFTNLLIDPSHFEDPGSAAYNVQNATAFLWPLQGLFTCIVYFRPKIICGIERILSSLRRKSKPAELEMEDPIQTPPDSNYFHNSDQNEVNGNGEAVEWGNNEKKHSNSSNISF